MRPNWGRGVMFLLSLLCGCNLAPRYRKPAESGLPATFRETGPWTPARPAETAQRGDWWLVMGDEGLNRLEDRIEHGSPQLAAAVARYEQARALVRRARADFFPRSTPRPARSGNARCFRPPVIIMNTGITRRVAPFHGSPTYGGVSAIWSPRRGRMPRRARPIWRASVSAWKANWAMTISSYAVLMHASACCNGPWPPIRRPST